MGKSFATTRFELGLATWAEEATNPNAGAGTPAAVGSWWQQQGAYPAVPTTLQLKVGAGDKGWLKQNLINLNVYNVKDPTYGAMGDGVTDDGPAIQAAVNAANAAGGGVVYFPPVAVGLFYRLMRPAVNPASIMLDNVHNITFMGDGYASKVEMFDDAGGNLVIWHAFLIQNGTTHIRFTNFQISGEGIVNAGSFRNNFITIAGNAADANTGTGHVDVDSMYWNTNTLGGSRVTFGGDDLAHIVTNIRYVNNGGDYASCLRGFWGTIANGGGGSGFSDHVEASYNWFGKNQVATAADCIRWNVAQTCLGNNFLAIGNIMNGSNTPGAGSNSACLGISRGRAQWNIVDNGGGITTQSFSMFPQLRGNVATAATASVGAAILATNQTIVGAAVVGNVSVCTVANNNSMLDVTGGTAPLLCSDNIVQMSGTTAPCITGGSTNGSVYNGNITVQNGNTANNGQGILSSNAGIANLQSVGNLIIGTTNVLGSGIQTNSSGANPNRNTSISFNMFINTQRAVDIRTAGTWADWRAINDNNCPAVTTDMIRLPSTNVGVTQEGPGGPGSQVAVTGATPVANVSAPTGSLCANTVGGQATALSYKESGAGVTGGTGGWFGIGAAELVFGALAGSLNTANRFFAPGGLGLAVETTTEIQAACTRAGQVRNLRGRFTAGTGGGTNTYTVRKNGVDTTVTIAVLNTATSGSDTTHAATVVQGDLLSVRVSKSSGAGTIQTNIVLGLEIV